MFDNCGIKQTFFVPAWCSERYPESFEPVLVSGHEIAHHGYLHELANKQAAAGERYWLERGAGRIIESFSGKRPAGYRTAGGHYSHRTADLLKGSGFLYDSSLMHHCFTYVLQTDTGPLLELPTGLHDDR